MAPLILRRSGPLAPLLGLALALTACQEVDPDSDELQADEEELGAMEGPPNQDDEALRELEREVFDASEMPADAEALDRLYSEDFVSINADGSYSDKQDVLELIEAGRFLGVEEIINDETRVRQFGEAAVITGRSKYVDPEGEHTAVVRHTMIWVREDGRWQMVGWQGTPLPGEAAYGPDDRQR